MSPDVAQPNPDDAMANIAAIKAVIAGWSSVANGSKCSLTTDDDGVCRVQFDGDGGVLLCQMTFDRLPEMLIWAKELNAAVLRRDRINGACTTNSPSRPRGRPLSPEVTERRRQITEMAERFQPASIRQLYYQAEKVARISAEDGCRLPRGTTRYTGFAPTRRHRVRLDQRQSPRWMRKSRSYRGIDHFLDLSIGTYRRDLWHHAPSTSRFLDRKGRARRHRHVGDKSL